MARYNIKIGDKTYEVEIGDVASSPVTVRVNGQTYKVEWEREQPAPLTTLAPAPARVETPAPAPPPAPSPVAITAGGGELVEITAPMPGKILKVNVAPGDEVAYEQQVCSLEAMKMESAIQSTAAGVVVSVNVSPGQSVQYGDVLVVVGKRGS